MKKSIILILILFPLFCSADFENFKWRYYKDIEASAGGLSRFVIDDELFANTESDLRDLRIIDNDSEEVPFELVVSRPKMLYENIVPEILNNSSKPAEGTTVILDFSGNNQGVNSLFLKTKDINFRRNVAIFGSDSPKGEWSLIKEGIYIYDYTDDRGGLKAQSTDVDFPESIFRYLKLIVSDDSNNPLKIDSVSGIRAINEPEKQFERTPLLEVVPGKDSTGNFTEAVLDLGQNGIPTDRLDLTVADDNFNRGVFVFSSRNRKDWTPVGQSYIFRYQTPKFRGENLALDIQETADRYLKIRINNGDDKALAIKKANTYSVFREVAFNAESGKKYKAYFGNPHARFPEYDLNKYFDFLETEKAPVLSLSAKKNNDSYYAPDKWGIKAPPAPKENKNAGSSFLMTSGLILAILLLSLLVYRFFRK